nr:G-type lectin S-receptor-like serine/threonine-protein kinase SD2-5 [Aegilops tauschii subsp. strangulata]
MGSFLPCSRSYFAPLLLLLILAACSSSQASNTTAKLSTVWSTDSYVLFRSVPGGYNLSFAATIYSHYHKYFFAICVFAPGSWNRDNVVVVWSANRDRPVQRGSTLNFTADGDLVLRDSDGSLVWSTNTSGQSIIGMKITESGNLVLFNHKNLPVWQSFDHPTDTMLPRQPLMEGMKLTPSIDNVSFAASNQFYLAVHQYGLHASVGSIQHQIYYEYNQAGHFTYDEHTYIALVNGSMSVFATSSLPTDSINNAGIDLPHARSLQYMRFESDGHLRLYEWNQRYSQWSFVQDIFELDYCMYPTVCGEYGICRNGQCICPIGAGDTLYFKQADIWNPGLGCIPVRPISSCHSVPAEQDHQLVALSDVSYFSFSDPDAVIISDEESCKQACSRNCSCKAAFHSSLNGPSESCLLVSEVLSMQGYETDSTAYLKVYTNHSLPPQNSSASAKKRKGAVTYKIAGASAAAVVFSSIVIVVVRWIRNQRKDDDEEEFCEVPGMPTRFTFDLLRGATDDFSRKLGEGGSGSVYDGQLGDERVAVKLLDRHAHRQKEFSAEVQTIGSIHHINLVKMIGFCADKRNRLLVFEYMSGGSLDKWIYSNKSGNNAPLGWCIRRRIITDIARGLHYLHEGCRQRIAHLDIKPQNILLDDKFNAKVADFGLSKLIDRDESRVVTRMRGTPGYMAPEWLTSKITEKVDVYSFGIVVIEILSGRKNIDYSQPDEGAQLIMVLREKAMNSQLEDMIDQNSQDMRSCNKEEVIEIMRLAMWCLQSDSNRRPSMSVVVKV